MKVDIVHWPAPVLLKGTKPVEQVDDDLRDTVKNMAELMIRLRGVGLAAPQVGIAKRFMLVSESGEPDDVTVVINPEILSKAGTEEMEEGCLSFPGMYGDIDRATKIEVRYRDLDWVEKSMSLEGFLARVFQHEFDHLNGVVFVDRMSSSDKMKNRQKLDELKQAHKDKGAK